MSTPSFFRQPVSLMNHYDEFCRLDRSYEAAERYDAEYRNELRARTWDVDAALFIGMDGEGFYVQLAADPMGNGYVLHGVADNSGGSWSVEQSLVPAADRQSLVRTVWNACEGYADTVREWGMRRPGTSRLGPHIRQMVREAMHERDDLDLAHDAQQEQNRMARECAP